MRYLIFTILVGILLFPLSAQAEEKAYVGSEVCSNCHQEQYDSFSKYSKKADSFSSIKKMEEKLSPEEYKKCFKCHTTGYGKNGGFVSETRTPGLKNPGCESCHGPGSVHAESEDPEDIVVEMVIEDCMTCHNENRVNAFDFRPLLYSGGH